MCLKNLGQCFVLTALHRLHSHKSVFAFCFRFFFLMMFRCKIVRQLMLHVTVKKYSYCFFFLLNSRNAVCILVVLVAGILTATYSLLFVVKWPNLDLKVSIDSKRFSRKQNDSPDNAILFETFHITPRRHICLTQAVILSSTSNFFATIATLCNKHATSSKKYD